MRTDRTLAAAAAACVAASALAGCGIPEDTDPEVIGEAPTDFGASSSLDEEVYEPTDDAEGTVENFLRAAAGNPDQAARDDRLAVFTGERDFSDLGDGINLLADVQYESEESDDFNTVTVTVTASIVGSYLQDGRVEMDSPERDYQEDIVVRRENVGDVFSVIEWPRQVSMLYSEFDRAYEEAPVYFLASGTEGPLVPDLRWIYGNLDAATGYEVRLGWLLQGPSDWARLSSRTAIPVGTSVRTSTDDGTLVVDLTPGESTEAVGEAADAMAAQIAWSLALSGSLELRVNGEEVASGDFSEWRDWNAIPSASDMGDTAYFVSDDTVWQFENGAIARNSADHPWVGFEAAGLRDVAVDADSEIAAIVAGENGPVLQTGSDPDEMTTVEDVSGSLRDPHWLRQDTILLIDDGVLTAVDTESGNVQVLGGEDVTALAVAPDGRRAAYVEDDLAMAAPLSVDVDGNFQLHEADARRIGTGVTEVSDVAWSAEDYLWIAGQGPDDQQLHRAAIDNSQLEVQSGTSGYPPISEIAAHPADPLAGNQTRGEPVIVVSGDDLYRVHTSSMEPIQDAEGEGVVGSDPFTVLE
ncbi:LpqB family beta-propeller domain-containing protein [Glycomyces salinus]|uniref:LpqB family beta-propeller domain-containing protein n=1 Tax=Glycomyces salinus TaxID=980294 RepID=UPI0018ED5171|nr:GerMN domain-containing protein [Glycomyces salinus]